MTVDKDILFFAFRYALGRSSSFAPVIVIRELKRHWHEFNHNDKAQIKKEIVKAIAMDKAGMDIDVVDWQNVLKWDDE